MVSIRRATDADRNDLRRLAGRDSARVPIGEVLIALEDGVLRAALESSTGRSIADPFVTSGHFVDALKAFAAEPAAVRGRGAVTDHRRLAQLLTRSIFGS